MVSDTNRGTTARAACVPHLGMRVACAGQEQALADDLGKSR